MNGRYSQVLTTIDSRDAADRIARGVVEARLAACVQVVGPITSTYWWRGEIEQAEEWQCYMKTTAELVPALRDLIKTLHTYDVPEVIATPITDGNPDYLAWIDAQTTQR